MKNTLMTALAHVFITFMVAGVLTVPQAVEGQAPESALEDIDAGRKLYRKMCAFCHGDEGGGDGPVADYLSPRPRDFTKGLYKFRTTETGEVPTDEDLFRTITVGIPGTAMPAWDNLSEVQRWQLVYYLKTFSPDDFDPEFPPETATIGEEIPISPQTIEQGKTLYQSMKCWECHGQGGKGDGPASGTHKDDWGFPILPFNLTQGWKYKGGSSTRDIYTRLTTGLNGTPMPSYADNLSEEERWYLAHHISALVREEQTGSKVVLKSKLLEGDLPRDPDDLRWETAEFIEVPLAGQVIAKPRWQNPSIETIAIRSLYNDREIAFLLEWDDRTKNTSHEETANPYDREIEGTYAKVNISDEPKEILRDAVAIEFPVRIPEGPGKPYFFMGQPGKSVNIWHWKADWDKDTDRGTSVEELNASGYRKPPTPQPPESQSVNGRGVWSNGMWKVVMTRSLIAEDKGGDVPFEKGKLIPMAFMAWDGSNGETGLKMSISSWYYLLLETSTTIGAYLYALIAIVFAAGFEWWLVGRVRSSPVQKSST